MATRKFAILTTAGYISVQPDGSLEFRDPSQPGQPGPYETISFVEIDPAPPLPGPPGPTPNPAHVAPGPLTEDLARQVVFATAAEFPTLIQVYNSTEVAEDCAEQLLLRTIWHLQQLGFAAARQQNPSGILSKDKLCVLLGSWKAYDCYRLGSAGVATQVQFLEVTPAYPIADPGISD